MTRSHILPELARGSRDISIRLLASPSLSNEDREALHSAATGEDRDRICREIGDRAVLDALDFAKHPNDVSLRLRFLCLDALVDLVAEAEVQEPVLLLGEQ